MTSGPGTKPEIHQWKLRHCSIHVQCISKTVTNFIFLNILLNLSQTLIPFCSCGITRWTRWQEIWCLFWTWGSSWSLYPDDATCYGKLHFASQMSLSLFHGLMCTIINYLIAKSEVVIAKSQTEDLLYWPSDSKVNTAMPRFEILL